MVLFLYKCYYVFFLFYSKYKRETPWFSATMALTLPFSLLLMSSMELLGVLDYITPNTLGDSPSTKRGKLYLLFIIPYLLICWHTMKYLIFNIAKASKTDGLSERYSFTPTKRDKIVCWLACFLSLSFVFIVVGMKTLLNIK